MEGDMKVAITGGTGFIGAHLIRALLDAGYSVRAVVRNPERAKRLEAWGVELHVAELSDREALQSAFAGCQQLYHMAACASVWERKSETYFNVNAHGTDNTLWAAKVAGIKRVVVTSSGGVMGPSVSGVVSEKKPRDLNYFNAYEASKAASDLVVLRYVVEEGMHVVLVSPTRVFGPYLWGEPASVSLMIKRYIQGNWRLIPGGRHWKGNYVDVQDVVQGHMKAMERGRPGSNYMLAGHNLTYGEFFKTLADVSGQEHTMVVAPIWLQMGFARVHAAFAKLRGKRPDLTTEWVRRGNYHWEVSPMRSIEELGVQLTPFKDSLRRTVDAFISKQH
ncbi:MAG TPA: hypothetical protein DD635_09005 [Flavobacteriales bacterium]|nr:hypothetical protein [Flavobacteriales bacterium]|tara:strand:- start:143 stop:1144 length:1002 start_codon:yes stop_codon:yes gene_type:complete